MTRNSFLAARAWGDYSSGSVLTFSQLAGILDTRESKWQTSDGSGNLDGFKGHCHCQRGCCMQRIANTFQCRVMSLLGLRAAQIQSDSVTPDAAEDAIASVNLDSTDRVVSAVRTDCDEDFTFTSVCEMLSPGSPSGPTEGVDWDWLAFTTTEGRTSC